METKIKFQRQITTPILSYGCDMACIEEGCIYYSGMRNGIIEESQAR